MDPAVTSDDKQQSTIEADVFNLNSLDNNEYLLEKKLRSRSSSSTSSTSSFTSSSLSSQNQSHKNRSRKKHNGNRLASKIVILPSTYQKSKSKSRSKSSDSDSYRRKKRKRLSDKIRRSKSRTNEDSTRIISKQFADKRRKSKSNSRDERSKSSTSTRSRASSNNSLRKPSKYNVARTKNRSRYHGSSSRSKSRSNSRSRYDRDRKHYNHPRDRHKRSSNRDSKYNHSRSESSYRDSRDGKSSRYYYKDEKNNYYHSDRQYSNGYNNGKNSSFNRNENNFDRYDNENASIYKINNVRAIKTPPLPPDANDQFHHQENYSMNKIPQPVQPPSPPKEILAARHYDFHKESYYKYYQQLESRSESFYSLSQGGFEPIKTKEKTPPLNQCHEISSTSNNISVGTLNPAEVNNEDDLAALKTKFQLQLKERLFNNGLESSDLSGSNEEEEQLDEKDTKTIEVEKAKKPHKKKSKKDRDSKRHSKKRLQSKRNKEDKQLENSNDDDEEQNYRSIRRSDRIKTIETQKQYHKEMKIAEKIKKHQRGSNNNHDSNSNECLNEQDEYSNEQVCIRSPPTKHESSCDMLYQQDAKSKKDDSLNLNEFEKTQSPNQKQFAPNNPVSTVNSNVLQALAKLYDHIDENFYACNRKKIKLNKEAKHMICDCSTSIQERALNISPCGDDCINRLLMIECGKRCPCGEFCTNKNFSKKLNAPITPFKTDMKGWGLKALNELSANSFLIEYVGDVIDVKEFKRRCEKYSEQNNEHFYFMSLNNDLFIDATRKGNISRFFNHSCDPNCETQKWTVNGQLRIGFFTKRQVKQDEELTFDYQFQTVGKKQQKCYCGSSKCRGFLGTSSNQSANGLNHIWEDDSSGEDDDDGSETDESKENNEGSDQDKSHNDESKYNTSTYLKKPKAPKTNSSCKKDFDINRQINSIKSLSNKENVLKLCQLMFRTQNLENRLDILNLLLNTDSKVSLQLFMDYHGLKLLCSWMIDLDDMQMDHSTTELNLNCKNKILNVLSRMPIKNKTILEECKLLTIVKKWSEENADKYNIIKYDKCDATQGDENDKEKSIWIREILDNLIDQVIDHYNFGQISKDILEKACSVYEVWNNLQQAFKIPKKQRNEERKEHERVLNLSQAQHMPIATASLANEIQDASTAYSNFNRDNHSRSFYGKSNDRHGSFYKKNKYYPKNYGYQQSYQASSSLTKEERRQKFEKEAREKEAEAAAKQAMEEQNQASQNLHNQPQELRWIFDSQKQQWIQAYVTIVPPISSPTPSPPSYCAPTLNQPNHSVLDHRISMIFNEKLHQTNKTMDSGSSLLQTHINKINISESHLEDLKQAMLHFKPDSKHPNDSSNSSLPLGPSSPSKEEDHETTEPNLNKSLNSIISKLPPNWKCKKHKNGRLFYYNIKTKVAQWEAPVNTKATNKLSATISKTLLTKSVEQSSSATQSDTTQLLSSLSPAQSNDNSNSQHPTQKITENNSESFKILKEQFRDSLSKLIISYLKIYLKVDCKIGRIKSTDDFKYLARKFTHTVMEKEMTRMRSIEDFEFNEQLKKKTHDYVKRYMSRFKGDYTRKLDEVN